MYFFKPFVTTSILFETCTSVAPSLHVGIGIVFLLLINHLVNPGQMTGQNLFSTKIPIMSAYTVHGFSWNRIPSAQPNCQISDGAKRCAAYQGSGNAS